MRMRILEVTECSYYRIMELEEMILSTFFTQGKDITNDYYVG
jgi:hypothetical protein